MSINRFIPFNRYESFHSGTAVKVEEQVPVTRLVHLMIGVPAYQRFTLWRLKNNIRHIARGRWNEYIFLFIVV
ncbi:MAG: hypothetical protein ACI35R_09475 [Bacillus sp. (in: firmicutes)]